MKFDLGRSKSKGKILTDFRDQKFDLGRSKSKGEILADFRHQKTKCFSFREEIE